MNQEKTDVAIQSNIVTEVRMEYKWLNLKVAFMGILRVMCSHTVMSAYSYNVI